MLLSDLIQKEIVLDTCKDLSNKKNNINYIYRLVCT